MPIQLNQTKYVTRCFNSINGNQQSQPLCKIIYDAKYEQSSNPKILNNFHNDLEKEIF